MASITDGLMRRIQQAFTFGSTTTASDDSGAVQSTQVYKNPIQTLDAVPIAFPYGFSSHAPIGSNILHMSVSGDLTNGVIVGKNHPPSRPRNLGAGCTVVYDQVGTRFDLTNNGDATVSGKGTLYLNFAEIVISGPVTSQGNITAGAGSNSSVELLHHSHSNSGGSGVGGQPVGGS